MTEILNSSTAETIVKLIGLVATIIGIIKFFQKEKKWLFFCILIVLAVFIVLRFSGKTLVLIHQVPECKKNNIFEFCMKMNKNQFEKTVFSLIENDKINWTHFRGNCLAPENIDCLRLKYFFKIKGSKIPAEFEYEFNERNELIDLDMIIKGQVSTSDYGIRNGEIIDLLPAIKSTLTKDFGAFDEQILFESKLYPKNVFDSYAENTLKAVNNDLDAFTVPLRLSSSEYIATWLNENLKIQLTYQYKIENHLKEHRQDYYTITDIKINTTYMY